MQKDGEALEDIMTKNESEEFTKAWLEAENIITLIDPQFVPEQQLQRPEKAGPKEIKLLLQFLRVLVKVLLHDKESTERENISLARLVDSHMGSKP